MSRFYALTLVVLATWSSRAQIVYPADDDDFCLTPHRIRGTCINIKTCPHLLGMIQQKPLSDQSVRFLQQSKCGNEGRDPKVCCESSGGSQTQDSLDNEEPPPNVVNHRNLRLLDLEHCGPVSDPRIIGGNVTGLFEYPWMALLAYDVNRQKTEFRCGGSVINNRYILTAAHCVSGLPSSLRLKGVRVGEHDLSTERDCEIEDGLEYCNEKHQDFGIESVISHPQFSLKVLHNDVALIRVDRNIDFRPLNAKPICLPITPDSKIMTTKFIVTGWGVTEQHISSPVMLKVKVPLFPQNKCASVYKNDAKIWYKQMCAGGDQGKDSCGGDSGGPLQGLTRTPQTVLYGIVSFGHKKCGIGGFPGVYSRVEYYLDWILDNMRD